LGFFCEIFKSAVASIKAGADEPATNILPKAQRAGATTLRKIVDPLDTAVWRCSIHLKSHLTWTRRTEVMMPKGKLSPEGEVTAAYGAAMVVAFQVLLNCLEENDAVLPRQFPDALGVYMEMVKSRQGDVSDMTLALLHDIRTATLT
jgi:hypothetical protein